MGAPWMGECLVLLPVRSSLLFFFCGSYLHKINNIYRPKSRNCDSAYSNHAGCGGGCWGRFRGRGGCGRAFGHFFTPSISIRKPHGFWCLIRIGALHASEPTSRNHRGVRFPLLDNNYRVNVQSGEMVSSKEEVFLGMTRRLLYPIPFGCQ